MVPFGAAVRAEFAAAVALFAPVGLLVMTACGTQVAAPRSEVAPTQKHGHEDCQKSIEDASLFGPLVPGEPEATVRVYNTERIPPPGMQPENVPVLRLGEHEIAPGEIRDVKVRASNTELRAWGGLYRIQPGKNYELRTHHHRGWDLSGPGLGDDYTAYEPPDAVCKKPESPKKDVVCPDNYTDAFGVGWEDHPSCRAAGLGEADSPELCLRNAAVRIRGPLPRVLYLVDEAWIEIGAPQTSTDTTAEDEWRDDGSSNTVVVDSLSAGAYTPWLSVPVVSYNDGWGTRITKPDSTPIAELFPEPGAVWTLWLDKCGRLRGRQEPNAGE